jgi:hypothetical protein
MVIMTPRAGGTGYVRFDEDDYAMRQAQIDEVSVRQEFNQILTGSMAEAATVRDAKHRALELARKQLIVAIEQANVKAREGDGTIAGWWRSIDNGPDEDNDAIKLE